jgi:hypothetical protein
MRSLETLGVEVWRRRACVSLGFFLRFAEIGAIDTNTAQHYETPTMLTIY